MHVVRCKLKMPIYRTGITVESEDRVLVKVVAEPDIAIPIGAGVARTPVN